MKTSALHLRPHAGRDDPPCCGEHPPLAQELLVQFRACYSAHLDPAAQLVTALDYHDHRLPAFQNRLRTRLLGAMASECREGHHRDVTRIRQDDRAEAAPANELRRLFGHPDPQ